MNKAAPLARMLPVRYCARDFTLTDLEDIRAIIASPENPTRAAIGRAVCQHLNWIKPDGGLKTMSCAVALLRMDRDGLIRLPPPMHPPVPQPGVPVFTAASDPQPIMQGVRGDIGSLDLRLVNERAQSRIWNELVARYHYSGYRRLPGAQLRYLVYADGRVISALGFASAAWRIADRDEFIGWSPEQRVARLHLVVNLARFLICPWVRIKFLASSVLGQVTRALPGDWHRRYNYRPVLLETYVECDRFAATCFRAANWAYVGETMGRGRCDRLHNRPTTSFKSIWVYPLDRRFRATLCTPDEPTLTGAAGERNS